jgi:hypothetical protein
MRLIDEIIELLSSDTPSVENALFKTQVLAHRLNEVELKKWVDHELRGYPNGDEVPAYRKIRTTVIGTINNGCYRITDQELPMMHLDDAHREKFQRKNVTQSISVIEAWAKDEDNVATSVPPEFYVLFSKGLGNGYEVG